MDTGGGHRLIRVNQAAHCADPGAGRVVSREAGAPRVCLWLSLSPPSPFHYRASSKHAWEQRGPQARRKEKGEIVVVVERQL